MTPEEALKTQHDLEAELTDAKTLFEETHAAISNIAFAAHTGDDDARKRLDKLHVEKAKHATEIVSLEVALTEARKRLAEARAAEAEGVAAEKAHQALALLESFAKRGEALDKALAAFIAEYADLSRDFRQLDALGYAPTSFALVKINMARAVATKLIFTDLRQEFLAPNERRDFVDVIAGWSSNVQGRVQARLNKSAATKAA